MDRDLLLKLIEEDDQDLLRLKPQSCMSQDPNERLIASFQEINDFISETGYEPHPNNENMREFALYSRLNSFRVNPDHTQLLLQYDTFKLLREQKKITSIEDIFKDDDFGLLEDWSDDIFNIKHIPKESTETDYVAQRKPCQNFQKYEHLFRQCQVDLASGKRKLLRFTKEQQIYKGDFFVLKGVLTYVARVGEKEVCNGKTNARLHCVFENGTESDMKLRSLARELYKDGRRITVHEDRLIDGLMNVTHDDIDMGYIYVLKSLSPRPEIQSMKNFYKIGFSRISIEERIKNAEQEPTYLMAPVALVASYQCFNCSSQKFELILHTFFSAACRDVVVVDKDGHQRSPREWFEVPLQVIDEAIELLRRREIENYHYDHYRQAIVERE